MQTTKKERAERMFCEGLGVQAIAAQLEADPSYIANALIERGHAPDYWDLYTSTGPQNRYTADLAGVMQFKNVSAAQDAAAEIERRFRHYAALGDRRGMHQCQVLALTGMNRAAGLGKWEEARVFGDWLVGRLAVTPGSRAAR